MTAQLPKELLESLLVRFNARRLQAIESIDALTARPGTAQLNAVIETAHKLAGIAATLGFHDIGRAAAEVDSHTSPLPLDPASRDRIQRLRDALAAGKPGRSCR